MKRKLADGERDIFIEIVMVLLIVVPLAISIYCYIIGDSDTGIRMLCFGLLWGLFAIGTTLLSKYYIVDDKQIIERCVIRKFNFIEWNDIARVELRYLDDMKLSETNTPPPKRAYFVLFSKTRQEKDNDNYANKKGIVFRVVFTNETAEVIQRYYKGTIVDKRPLPLDQSNLL